MKRICLLLTGLLFLNGCSKVQSFDHNALEGLEGRKIQVIWSYVDRSGGRGLKQQTFLLSEEVLQKNRSTLLEYNSDEAGFSSIPQCFISIFADQKMIKNIPFSDFQSLQKNTHFKKLLKHSKKIDLTFKTVEKEEYDQWASQSENIFYREEKGDRYEVGFYRNAN